jgi:Tol biopolymer transport system component
MNAAALFLALSLQEQPAGATKELLEELKSYPHRILYESFRDGNWELYVSGADGSNPVNLTRTPDVDELYAKVSPDGAKICFMADEGKGEGRSRNLYVMNADGTGRAKIADRSRDPCWSGDGTKIAYLRCEFEKFMYSDIASKGLRIYDVAAGRTSDHPHAAKIEHLFGLNWSPDGRWFVSTVHGGMGFKHGIIALESEGEGVWDLHLKGCRPDLSPDGKKVVWGHGDYAIGLAELDLSSKPPKATFIRNLVTSKEPLETYHADWSPDGRYVSFSYGPKFKGKNLKGMLPEMNGVEAPGWNTCVADVAATDRWVAITLDGKSNKEAEWLPARAR